MADSTSDGVDRMSQMSQQVRSSYSIEGYMQKMRITNSVSFVFKIFGSESQDQKQDETEEKPGRAPKPPFNCDELD